MAMLDDIAMWRLLMMGSVCVCATAINHSFFEMPQKTVLGFRTLETLNFCTYCSKEE